MPKTIHGVSRSHRSEYKILKSAIRRCTVQSDKNYKEYGARGITVDASWLGPAGCQRFIADMGPKPSRFHTLDRIDNDRGYGPANCRWATRKVQSNNSRRTKLFTIGGETLCLSDWAQRFGLLVSTLSARLRRGIPFDVALKMPVGSRGWLPESEQTNFDEVLP